ncbi:hypothetical protein GOQ27_05760 [Clostridium sp. D2Q-11]|uniref:Uncharacterized protein n=1 Tax=Anaeromonas frigoriresistens TaxID=2683708 RepID=A0A942UYI7_9FIRM|nr:hypothetical protein [Anaeromonas frigoriresistens]MBS4537957.1 hypothetical protein [Anaeromonas frigoriresistens]
MIKEIISQENKECIGGFIAVYADAIMAHMNPSKMHKYDIAVVIKNDKTIWATRVIQEDSNQVQENFEWINIVKDNIVRKSSPIMKKTCYFQIKKGELYGTYVISDDLILNEEFCSSKSYLDFITR